MKKIIVKQILLMIFALFLITSCNSEQKFQPPVQRSFSKDSISLDVHHVKLNDNDRKFTDDTDYIYFYPKINGKPTDVHIRAGIGPDSDPEINIGCGLFYYQGDPMKEDSKYSDLVRDKRLSPREQGKDVYQTSYKEQLEILKYVKQICEEELHVEHIGCVFFKYDDIGEVNVDITEHCGIIKHVRKRDHDEFDFTPVMEKTRFAKDLKNIFSDYDIYFTGPLAFSIHKVPYSEYAAKHNFRTKHDLQYVYLVNNHLIILRKKAIDSKR